MLGAYVMVCMIFFNLLILLRKIEVACGVDFDLVHTPIMAHPLLYSKNYAERGDKKSEKRSNKMRFLLDFPATPCYNSNIRIGNQPSAAFLPVYTLANHSTGKKLA